MKKVLGVLAVLVIMLALVKMNKPSVTVNIGSYTPSQVYGPYVAKAKRMTDWKYKYKITVFNVTDLDPEEYKAKHPMDSVLGSRWSSTTILTDNLANIFADLADKGVKWYTSEIIRDGKLVNGSHYDYKYLGLI